MTFNSYGTVIAEGDLVIAYMSPDAMTSFAVQSGQIYNNRFGSFHHKDMIGKPWGSVMLSHNKTRHIYLLHPTPELWTLVLPHRTQILYMPDISYITSQLGIRPGSVVVESGTGSGSFSHSLARTISPNGKLHTFEFHEQRATTAKAEFELHKLSSIIEVNCRDVCKDGFGLDGVADAVFLDLPSPWEAVASAKQAFKKGQVGRICSFSPCMEQIQKTATAMQGIGFFDIKMYEVLIRPFEVRRYQYKPLANGPPKPRPQRDQHLKRKAEEPNAGSGNKKPKSMEESSKKLEDAGEAAAMEDVKVEDKGKEVEVPEKATAEDREATASAGLDAAIVDGKVVGEEVEVHEKTEDANGDVTASTSVQKDNGTKVEAEAHAMIHATRPLSEVRGHTSYLLFASILP
ncbi:tRNA (adenine(58)-N(1))-methyltransferase catalytic subunit trmt61a [Dinochytrium kinnereticum]|nr:tRNA (adenine(58)-N(1))-methyltransferase catalytic subunit trmt61a [Dinochytrium kinnereticum]